MPPTAVYALGAGGPGVLDLPAATLDTGLTGDPGDGLGGLAGTAEGEVVDVTAGPSGEAPVDIPAPGEETLASVIPAGLGDSGIPAPTLRAYRAAAEVLAREEPGCRVDWALLAGIGRVEADHGRFGGASVSADGVSVPAILGPRLDGSLAGTMVILDSDGGVLDGDAAYDRAVGPMQFLPGTWRRWGSDGDRDGTSDPQDIDDASLAAARYLCNGSSGLDQPGPAGQAVRRYNNSGEYVQLVLATADGYRSGGGLSTPQVDLGRSFEQPAAPGWDAPPDAVLAGGPFVSGPPPAGAVPAAPLPMPTTQPVRSTTEPTTEPTTPSTVPTGTPTTGTPTTGTPTTGTPTTGTPTTGAPTTGGPATGAPTTGAPTTGAPTTAGPTTEAPTTGGPTTGGPTTETPTGSPTDTPTTGTPTTGTPTLPSCEPAGATDPTTEVSGGGSGEPVDDLTDAPAVTVPPCLPAEPTGTPDPTP